MYQRVKIQLCELHPKAPSKNCRVCKNLGLVPSSITTSQPTMKKPEKKHGPIPIWGNKHTYNLSSLIRKNIIASPYFDSIMNLKHFNEILEEIIKNVSYVEPWTLGTNHIPSTLFCILFRFFVMKLTEAQVNALLEHSNPYVRCSGLLYLRFICNPEELYARFRYILTETQSFSPTPGSDTTLGEYAEKLLTDQNYYGLQFPRIPVLLSREITKQCLLLEKRRERSERNKSIGIEKDSKIGVYMEDGSIQVGLFKHRDDKKVHVQIDGKDLHVPFADIEIDYERQTGLDTEKLLEKVKEIEVQHAVANKKSDYSRRPVSYKEALSTRKTQARSRSRSPVRKQAQLPKLLEISPEEMAHQALLEAEYTLSAQDGHNLSETLRRTSKQDSIGPESLRLG